jgi:hypothetical protein
VCGYHFEICSLPIYESNLAPVAGVPAAEEASQSSHVGSVEPEQSIMGFVVDAEVGVNLCADGQADSCQSPAKGLPSFTVCTKK